MKCDFSYSHYRQILKEALRNDFVLTSFRDFEKNKKNPKIIILRHDIDYSPQRALVLAKIENKLSIKSTYFIRVHGEYYHPFDRINYPIFQQIINLKHEIGLHFEARNLSLIFDVDMVELFLREKKILENVFDFKIESASEHGDLDNTKNFWQNHFFTRINKAKVGIKHFPQEKKYRDFHYISDSRQQWIDGCLCRNLEKFKKIQALIHPDLWGKNAIKERNYLLKSNPIIKSNQFSIQYQKNMQSLLDI